MELILICSLIGLIPMFIAKAKGCDNLFGWWVYGALLFIIALIHSLFMGNKGKICYDCKEWIKLEATTCKHCGKTGIVVLPEFAQKKVNKDTWEA